MIEEIYNHIWHEIHHYWFIALLIYTVIHHLSIKERKTKVTLQAKLQYLSWNPLHSQQLLWLIIPSLITWATDQERRPSKRLETSKRKWPNGENRPGLKGIITLQEVPFHHIQMIQRHSQCALGWFQIRTLAVPTLIE